MTNLKTKNSLEIKNWKRLKLIKEIKQCQTVEEGNMNQKKLSTNAKLNRRGKYEGQLESS